MRIALVEIVARELQDFMVGGLFILLNAAVQLIFSSRCWLSGEARGRRLSIDLSRHPSRLQSLADRQDRQTDNGHRPARTRDYFWISLSVLSHRGSPLKLFCFSAR